MKLFNLRTAADYRAFLYTLLPTLTALLVSLGVVEEAEGALWAGLATAVAGPVLAAYQARTLSTFRTAFYSLGAAVQALVVGYGLVSTDDVGVWAPLVTTVVGFLTGGVAVANTDTSASTSVGQHSAGN